jgi:hypothetical protein
MLKHQTRIESLPYPPKTDVFRTAKLHKSDCRPSLNLRPKWRKKENCWRLGAEVFPLKLARQPDCQFIVANAATASEAPG